MCHEVCVIANIFEVIRFAFEKIKHYFSPFNSQEAKEDVTAAGETNVTASEEKSTDKEPPAYATKQVYMIICFFSFSVI